MQSHNTLFVLDIVLLYSSYRERVSNGTRPKAQVNKSLPGFAASASSTTLALTAHQVVRINSNVDWEV